jgi:hypothetical protein
MSSIAQEAKPNAVVHNCDYSQYIIPCGLNSRGWQFFPIFEGNSWYGCGMQSDETLENL